MNKILLTGSCGFIFSNFLRSFFKEYSDVQIIGIDRLDEHCNKENIFNHKNYKLYVGDIANDQFIDRVFDIEQPDIVINAAARSFVGSSLDNPIPFIYSNVLGTQVLCNASVKYKVKRFIQYSTDEIYGQLLSDKDPSWTESSIANARNPYACSKLAGELIVKSTYETFGLAYNITRCCNNYGPMQNTRNLIPKIITSNLNGLEMPIQGEGKEIREFIHVDDSISALNVILDKGPVNQEYNIGSGFESPNIETAKTISKIMGLEPKIKFVEQRRCNDFRYSVDCTKLKSLGWKPKVSFEEGILRTVDWYKKNTNYCIK